MVNFRKFAQLVIILIVGGMSLVLVGGLWRGKGIKKSQDVQQSASQSEMKLTDIEFTEMEQGKRFWTLKASEAVYHHDRQVTNLKAVHLTFHLENDEGDVILESRDGVLHAGTKDIELLHDVRATLPKGYTLNTEKALYNHQLRTVSSNDPIHVQGPGGSIEGKVWEYKISDHKASLVGVKATLIGSKIGNEKF